VVGIPSAYKRDASERINRVSSIPFALAHLVPLAVIWTGLTWRDVVLCAVLYQARVFFITAGYHRYFAHRSYKLNRFWQFVMAFGGTTAAQKGPLWWAALHRDHHRYAEAPDDIHSPLKGFMQRRSSRPSARQMRRWSAALT
jgi:stearoyl-CoA desaturase (delta-9 desaturase)